MVQIQQNVLVKLQMNLKHGPHWYNDAGKQSQHPSGFIGKCDDGLPVFIETDFHQTMDAMRKSGKLRYQHIDQEIHCMMDRTIDNCLTGSGQKIRMCLKLIDVFILQKPRMTACRSGQQCPLTIFEFPGNQTASWNVMRFEYSSALTTSDISVQHHELHSGCGWQRHLTAVV
ncbi:hypothetical protein CBL_11206 [Carabus blaptoides fortunei]